MHVYEKHYSPRHRVIAFLKDPVVAVLGSATFILCIIAVWYIVDTTHAQSIAQARKRQEDFIIAYKRDHQHTHEVLAAVVTPLLPEQPTPAYTIITATPTQAQRAITSYISTNKPSYKIAVIGDSFVDTMGDYLPYLDHALQRRYPRTFFDMYNYGIGGQGINQGLARFSSPYHYNGRNYPAIPDLHPDIIVVASFAYNPLNPYERDRHWIMLDELVKNAKSVTPNVYVLSEIAPLIHDFGRGSINWDHPEIHVSHIIDGLENAEGIAKAEHVTLIDAFAKSQVNSSHEGKREYINAGDNIHPSLAGHEFMANLMAQLIRF